MSLEIEKREREGIAILDLKGRINHGDEVSSFRKVVQELVSRREPEADPESAARRLHRFPPASAQCHVLDRVPEYGRKPRSF